MEALKLSMPVPFDALLAFRDRLVSNLDFQRRISAFPGLRWIARRQARDVFDLCAGFVYSQVLLACVELDVLALVRREPRTIEEIGLRCGLATDAAEQLVRAACALGLLSPRHGQRYGLGMRGAAIVANDGLMAMIRHHRLFYEDLRDPVALLREPRGQTALQTFWGYARADGRSLGAADVAAYSELMAASQTLVADEILSAFPFKKHSRLLDIGGGEGEFVIRVARRFPHLTFMHFDLPAVSARASQRFERAGIAARVACHRGSFLEDALPAGADIVTLVRVLHDHDEKNVECILAAARRALAPGGVLLIAEPLAGTAHAEPVTDAYFAFYLRAMGSGRARTFSDLAGLLQCAGFARIRELPTNVPLQVRIVVAEV